MMSTASSKVIAPILPLAIMHRETLVTQIRSIIATEHSGGENISAHCKLFLLCAPAGYGKTTLLADFAQSTGIPCCWYFLDQNDTDSYTFLSTLLTSIRQRFPGFGTALDPLLVPTDEVSSFRHKEHSHSIAACVEALVRALHTEITQRFVLTLCNYHEVDESPAITDIVNRLLQKMPPQGVLIIESRATPSIEFATLLAHRQAIGWGGNMLRVTAQEVLELARIQGVTPLSQAEAEQLALAFDGWIAGIFLGTRLGDAALLRASTRTGCLQGLPTMRVERQKLFAYLVNEIFSRQPAVYAFLKEAAILQQMDASRCNALLDITNASEHLDRLARQGMFVSCCDDGPQLIYTCHPVLRELLCDELRSQLPERFAELHRRAAELFAASQEYDRAITHALTAGDNHAAAQMIICAYEQMSTQKHGESLLHWIHALPSTTIESYPQLLLIQVGMYLMRGEHARAFPLLDAAARLQTHSQVTPDPGDLKLQTEIALLRSKALFQIGKYGDAQLLCQQILDTTPLDDISVRAEAHARFGICADLLGDLAAGIEHLQKALQLWGRNTVQPQVADAHSALASSYNLLGNFALAEHHIARAISCCNQLHDEKGKVNSLIRMGVYKQRQGAFDEAETVLLQTLTTVRECPTRFGREEAYILVNLGSVYQDQGAYERSLETLEKGVDQARHLQDNYLVNCGLCYLAMTYLLMGDASTAMLLISETRLPLSHGSNIGYERAIRDLTYGTILLSQHRYDEAYSCFIVLEAALKMAGLKRELLRVKLRLAACQMVRKEMAEAMGRLEEITAIVEQQEGYESLILTGLTWHPELYQIIKTHPALEQLRTLLHIEAPAPVSEETAIPVQAASTPLTSVSNQSRLRVQAFGEPAVFLDGQHITRWRMARAMELFFFLLDCGRPMRKEQIITALWPEIDEQISQTFHSTIHYLRKALNESCIVSHSGIYTLNLCSFGAGNVHYDVTLFKERYIQAKQLLAEENDEEARAVLLTMLELYQGDYVQPFYNDWCTLRRDELRLIYLEVRGHLARLAWRQEAFDESAVHWQHILAMDSWTEEAHYGLMKYYMHMGKRGLALRQYQRYEEILQQELGVRPGTAIQNLYQRLISTSASDEQARKNK